MQQRTPCLRTRHSFCDNPMILSLSLFLRPQRTLASSHPLCYPLELPRQNRDYFTFLQRLFYFPSLYSNVSSVFIIYWWIKWLRPRGIIACSCTTINKYCNILLKRCWNIKRSIRLFSCWSHDLLRNFMREITLSSCGAKKFIKAVNSKGTMEINNIQYRLIISKLMTFLFLRRSLERFVEKSETNCYHFPSNKKKGGKRTRNRRTSSTERTQYH